MSLTNRLLIEALGQRIAIRSPDAELHGLCLTNWGSLAAKGIEVDIEFQVARKGPSSIAWTSSVGERGEADDAHGLLFDLDQAVIVELQRLRSDLYFLHAAAIELDGRACLLIASSGSGKSITTWALLHHGFGYLSDELSPIDLTTLQVYPYPHALCLKQHPPEAYRLPEGAVLGDRRLYLPVAAMPCTVAQRPLDISAVVFLSYRPGANLPSMQPVSAAEAAARIYAHALNPLAHENSGLTAAARIGENVPGFELNSADLSETCLLIRRTLQSMTGSAS